MLKIAVQKSDRISKGFLELLSKCGLRSDGLQSKLYCKFSDLPMELYFVRGSDMPALLEEKFDVAILGTDSFMEYNLGKDLEIRKSLGFAKCHISFSGKDGNISNIADINGKIIATSYRNILANILEKGDINAKIVDMNGSVESAIGLGIADTIFDVVETGSTLIQHGLKEYFKSVESEAILIAKTGLQSEILDKLLFRINAFLNGKHCKYVMFNLQKDKLDSVISMLPSGKSPTVLNLANDKYIAIHILCEEGKIWDLCEKLEKVGAEDILVLNVDLRFL